MRRIIRTFHNVGGSDLIWIFWIVEAFSLLAGQANEAL